MRFNIYNIEFLYNLQLINIKKYLINKNCLQSLEFFLFFIFIVFISECFW